MIPLCFHNMFSICFLFFYMFLPPASSESFEWLEHSRFWSTPWASSHFEKLHFFSYVKSYLWLCLICLYLVFWRGLDFRWPLAGWSSACICKGSTPPRYETLLRYERSVFFFVSVARPADAWAWLEPCTCVGQRPIKSLAGMPDDTKGLQSADVCGYVWDFKQVFSGGPCSQFIAVRLILGVLPWDQMELLGCLRIS